MQSSVASVGMRVDSGHNVAVPRLRRLSTYHALGILTRQVNRRALGLQRRDALDPGLLGPTPNGTYKPREFAPCRSRARVPEW